MYSQWLPLYCQQNFYCLPQHSKIMLSNIRTGTVTWDESLFLKQFVACSASTKILPGKHCILHNTVNHAYSFVESNSGAHTQVSKSGEVSDFLKSF